MRTLRRSLMAVRPVVANLVLLCGSLFVTFGILELSLRDLPCPHPFPLSAGVLRLRRGDGTCAAARTDRVHSRSPGADQLLGPSRPRDHATAGTGSFARSRTRRFADLWGRPCPR